MEAHASPPREHEGPIARRISAAGARLVKVQLKHPFLVLLAVALVTVASVLCALRLTVRTGFEALESLIADDLPGLHQAIENPDKTNGNKTLRKGQTK